MISAAQIEFLVILLYYQCALLMTKPIHNIQEPWSVRFWQTLPIAYAPLPVHKLLKFTVFLQMNLRS